MPTSLLVAEDEAATRDWLRDFVEAQGYAVATAAVGKQALAAACDHAPDLDVLGLNEGSERTADFHFGNLRATVEADLGAPTHVHAVFGVGYRLGTPVQS